jgi:PAS domain S-box-containing protein
MTFLGRLRAVPLAAKLAIAFVIASEVPIVAAGLLEIRLIERQKLENTRARLGSVADHCARGVGETLDDAGRLARALAGDAEVAQVLTAAPSARDWLVGRLRARFRWALSTSAAAAYVSVVDPSGAIAAASDDAPPAEPTLPVAAPVGAPSGARVILLVRRSVIEARIPRELAGPGSRGLLIGSDAPRGDADVPAAEMLEETCAVQGRPGLAVAYRVPAEIVAAMSKAVVRTTVAIGGAAALSAGLVGIWVAIGLSRRLRSIEAAARQVAAGAAAVAIDAGPADEVGRLAETLRQSLAALAATRLELGTAAERLEAYARELEQRVDERTREIAAKNEALTRAAAEATGIARAASELGREDTVEGIIALLAAETKNLIGVDFGLVFVLSKDGRELVPAPGHAGEAARLGRERIRLDDESSSLARAFRGQKTALLQGVAATSPDAPGPEAMGTSLRLIANLGVHAAFAVPLLARDRPIGLLLAGFHDPSRSPTKRDLRLAETIAAEAGVAIDRARIRAALAEREGDLRGLFDQASDMIFAYDAAGRFTRANRATLEALGYTLDELREKTIVELSDDSGRFGPLDVPSDISGTLDSVLVARDGRRVPIDLRTNVVRRDGEVVEVQAIGRQLGARRELENRRLEAARLKTAIELASATAHNLNQPLTGIIGFVDLLLADCDDKEAAEALRAIQKQAARMADIVRKMKTLTSVETETYVGGERIVKLT